MAPPDSPRRKTRERSHHHHHHRHYHHDRRASHSGSPRKSRGHATSSDSSSHALSAGALAKLNYLNQNPPSEPEITPKSRQKRERGVYEERYIVERSRKQHKRKKRRVVSGALLEEAEGEKLRGLRGGTYNYEKNDKEEAFFKRRKRLCLLLDPTNPEVIKLTCLVRDWYCHLGLAPGYYHTSGSGGY